MVGIKTGFINKASGTPANLVVDMGAVYESVGDCWKNLAQGGESTNRMLGGVTDKVKALRPQYIRIDHIFDNYGLVYKDGSGKINFNWTNLDQTVSDITASGALPFFSLSYMPPVISVDGKVESLPANWADWEYVVQATVEHYSGPTGMNLSNVYYEVWNEPDLFGGFKIGGSKSYSELYIRTQRGVLNAKGVKPFKLGGPATSGLYKNWIQQLLNMAQNGSIRLDFLSWHNYYADPDRYDTDIRNMVAWMSEYPGFENTELIVSEMGINPKNDAAYDGNLSAIHTISSMSALQIKAKKCFSFEIIDGEGPSKYWGRWGLLTNAKYGEPTIKPRYEAIRFLNKMSGSRINVTGSGTWVKAFGRHDGKNILVMVSNFAPDGHQEVVPFKITNLPFKKFSVKYIRFQGGTSVAQEVNIEGDSWETTLGMSPNTALIVVVTPE